MSLIKERRAYGEHLTPSNIFEAFILPHISDKLQDFVWVDMYAGEGNLIFPILERIPAKSRDVFFKDQVYMFDIQEKMVRRCIERAVSMGIDDAIAADRIQLRDNLKSFPNILNGVDKPLYHITNPPYLYIGHIRKNPDMTTHLSYFEDKNEGYQDLYQIAMMNDLRNGLNNMIYIIPSNFFFGDSVSNKIRDDFLKHYIVKNAYVFENQIFDDTGINACVCFFERKTKPGSAIANFHAAKVKKDASVVIKHYELNPRYHYRAGSQFAEFVLNHRALSPISISFYLKREDISAGDLELRAVDVNAYNGGKYHETSLSVNDSTMDRVRNNILYIRTVDTGSDGGRLGIGVVQEDFGVDAIYVSSKEYRTHPIQIFIEPPLSKKDQLLLRDYFNLVVERLRTDMDSDFLTTYRYSSGDYARKYMGLAQVKALIETFPILMLTDARKDAFKSFILSGDLNNITEFIGKYSERKIFITDFFTE